MIFSPRGLSGTAPLGLQMKVVLPSAMTFSTESC